MNKTVFVLGGYGLFGERIVIGLLKHNISVVMIGRNQVAAEKAKERILTHTPQADISIALFDVDTELDVYLKKLSPYIVINTCGPFQRRNHQVARLCIEAGVHYIDLADGRDYVDTFSELDKIAKENKVIAITGASTVPGLSSAVVEEYKSQFSAITSLTYGIAPGQKTPRGLATTEAILTYIGSPIVSLATQRKPIYGWQDLYRQAYPVIGKRWMANCDIPDLDLFPHYYHIDNIHFSAGMENPFLHLSIWLISWGVRLFPTLDLVKQAKLLLKMSHYFDYGFSADGGMHMIIRGLDLEGKEKTMKWFIIATQGDGPYIPTIPSVVLTKNILSGTFTKTGAMPCIGLVSLSEYLSELQGLCTQVFVN